MNNLFAPENFQVLAKGVIIFFEILLAVFVFLLTRQVRLMNRSYQTAWAPVFTLLSAVLFIVVLILILISFLVL